MDVREKLVGLIKRAIIDWEHGDASEWIADHLIANGVTVQENTAADVAPVRHGRWEKQSGLYSCSECGMTCPYDVQADVIEYWACNYCPNCGAKMDGGED